VPEESNSQYPFDLQGFYQIRVQGKLNKCWLEYLNGLNIAISSWGQYSEVTLISGWLADQTALGGLLDLLNDLGVVILTVERHEEEKDNEISHG